MFEFQSQHYEPKTDDLFLIYTAIDPTFNANGWKVEDIDHNITSGLGRPGVIKPKDPTNPADKKQSGNFVHPEFPNASLQELLDNQEQYSIARAVRLDRPSPSANWRVWLHVTDPKAKAVLKNASTNTEYPHYISPQVITFPADYPDEDAAQSYKHWIISHWAFVDTPAYGEQMKVRGNCYGHINDCKIKLQNASTGNFCVKDAIRVLSSSSHVENNSINGMMAAESSTTNNNTTGQPVQTGQQTTYAWQPVTHNQPLSITTTDNTAQTSQPNPTVPSKTEPEPGSAPRPGQDSTRDSQPTPNNEEPKEAQAKPKVEGVPESVDELQKLVVTQNEIIKDLQKRFSTLEKDNITRKESELRYKAASKVARYQSAFKSPEAFNKAVDTVMRYATVMSEQEVEEYLRSTYSNVQTIAPKSASVYHEVPNFQQNNASTSSSDINRRLIELVDMFSGDSL